MLTIQQFRTLLRDAGTITLNGGLGTELEARGHHLVHRLWSAIMLKDNPAAIEELHRDYFAAGANVAITASCQASTDGLCKHFCGGVAGAMDLIKLSAQLARKAAEAAAPGNLALVAGSVGPYGAYRADGAEYRGDYRRSTKQLQNFHRPRIRALVEAGADLLALETMPQLAEIEALLELLRREFPGVPVWVSCTLADSSHISDGTSLEQVLRVVNEYRDVVVAVGINCVPWSLVTEVLQLMRRRTKLPLICYPNSGEAYEGYKRTWSAEGDARTDWAALTQEWYKNGARLIGGCCRTGPQHVQQIARSLSGATSDGP